MSTTGENEGKTLLLSQNVWSILGYIEKGEKEWRMTNFTFWTDSLLSNPHVNDTNVHLTVN